MPVRTFTVFQDAPTAKPPTLRPLGRSASAAAVLTTTSQRSENVVVSLPEKENLHPLTGLRTRSVPSGKKRKASESNSVLATKVLAVAEVSDTAKSKPKRVDLKRKASSQAASGKTKLKREHSDRNVEDRNELSDSETSSSPAREAHSRAGSRSSLTILEPIEEEAATEVADEEKPSSEAQSLTQALIDSRCYELTVSPLADVSGAYLQSSEPKKEEVKDEDLPEYRMVKESFEKDSAFASQIRDYFLSEGSRVGSQSSVSSSTSTTTSLFSAIDELDVCNTAGFVVFSSESITGSALPVTPKKPHGLVRSLSLPSTPSSDSVKDKEEALPPLGPVMLSTPERKELYATFTFMSPKSSATRNM